MLNIAPLRHILPAHSLVSAIHGCTTDGKGSVGGQGRTPEYVAMVAIAQWIILLTLTLARIKNTYTV